jgi:hypothetical protein
MLLRQSFNTETRVMLSSYGLLGVQGYGRQECPTVLRRIQEAKMVLVEIVPRDHVKLL